MTTAARATVVVHRGQQALADAAAARLVVALVDAQSARGVAHVSMTGGSMGSQIIASRGAGCRRATPSTGRRCTCGGATSAGCPPATPTATTPRTTPPGSAASGLDPANVHRVAGPDTSESAEESARPTATTLHAAGGGLFDVMVLGVGPDGHVASLFPHHPAGGEAARSAVAVHDSPKPPPTRVSLTRECLERSREVWFLVSGADKADAVRRGVTGAPFETTPAAHVHGVERTLWLVDTDAAADLER